jgi:alpha-tubulin suppressor-like RCC1 family protein
MELLRLGALALLVGCYSPSFTPCQVKCGEGMPECPDGTACNQGYCQAPADETVCQGRAAAVAAGRRHTCAVGDDFQVYCWGDNRGNQLGRPGIDRTGTPGRTTPEGVYPHIAAGESHSCAIDDSLQLWCWGSNASGQLGTGDIGTPAPDPETIATDNGGFGFSAVSVSWANTLVVQDGELWAWGDNGYGQLGTDVGAESGVPVPVDTTRAWTQVAAGREHACALAGDELYCWGEATAAGSAAVRATTSRPRRW